jgi:dTDP-4-dehydrorhamnose reductase
VQCRATVLAMRAIREVNPAARLVQTDDMGRTFSTPPLAYQAAFQNERRWLAIDLLAGRVTRAHPLWSYLQWAGATTAELGWFADHPCPPDIIGVNYYLTSDRFLDHRVHRYPPHLHGGNGRVSYADTEAVRVRPEGLVGHEAILVETFERYRQPIALTEVHAGGTPDEQAHWLHEAWTGACAALARGADVRAVTAWALLGSFDWDTLVTACHGRYEPGAFDARDAALPRTRVGELIEALASRREPEDACEVGRELAWWHRVDRLFHRDERTELRSATSS